MAEKQHLIVLCPLYPPHVGGLESHAWQWNQAMVKRGHVVTVWTPHVVSDSSYEEKIATGIQILRFPAFELIHNYPVPKIWKRRFWQQFKIIRNLLLAQKSPRVVIISRTRFFLTSLLAMILAKIYRKTWVHIEHGSDFVYLHNLLLRSIAHGYDYTLGYFVLRGANMVVANSQASATFVSKISGRQPNAVIYRGTDVAAIDAIAPLTNPGLPAIVYVGRLIDSKGVHDFLSALAALKKNTWQAWIIGDGSQKNALQQQVQSLGIKDRVHFFNETSWQDAMARIKSATMLVNPSYNEGAPTTVLEAAIAGTPIVATNVGGTSELVTHKREALLVTPGNVPEIAEAMKLLLQDSDLREKMAVAARQRVSHGLSWNETALKYEELLDRVK